MHPTRGKRKRKRSAFEVPTAEKAVKYSKQTRTERRSFKNIRLQPMPLAESPKVSNVRRGKKRFAETLKALHSFIFSSTNASIASEQRLGGEELLQDYQLPLMMLEQQNKRRVLQEWREQMEETLSVMDQPVGGPAATSQTHQTTHQPSPLNFPIFSAAFNPHSGSVSQHSPEDPGLHFPSACASVPRWVAFSSKSISVTSASAPPSVRVSASSIRRQKQLAELDELSEQIINHVSRLTGSQHKIPSFQETFAQFV